MGFFKNCYHDTLGTVIMTSRLVHPVTTTSTTPTQKTLNPYTPAENLQIVGAINVYVSAL